MKEGGYEILVLDDNSIRATKTFFLEGGVLDSVDLKGRIILEKPARHWVALGSFCVLVTTQIQRGMREGDVDSVQGYQAIVGKTAN